MGSSAQVIRYSSDILACDCKLQRAYSSINSALFGKHIPYLVWSNSFVNSLFGKHIPYLVWSNSLFGKHIPYLVGPTGAFDFICTHLIETSLISKQDLFQDLFQSIVTTFVMLMGEVNYGVIFLENRNIYHPELLYPVFILFCIAMPIIFLNLLVSAFECIFIFIFIRYNMCSRTLYGNLRLNIVFLHTVWLRILYQTYHPQMYKIMFYYVFQDTSKFGRENQS